MATREKSTPAPTLKALYQEITGDLETHQRTVDAAVKRMDPRRQAIIKARVAGQSYHQIGAAHGITAASVRDTILRALENARKTAHHEPRYNHKGRRPPGQE